MRFKKFHQYSKLKMNKLEKIRGILKINYSETISLSKKPF